MKPEDFTSDEEFDLVNAWLLSFPNQKTRTAYTFDIRAFSAWLKVDLRSAQRGDIDLYAEQLPTSKPSVNAQRRALSALRSLYRYLHQEDKIDANPAKNLKLPKAKDDLAERIMSETEFHQVLAKEENPRNALLIQLLYATGGRISEALGTKWKDASEREDGGQIVYFGKRDKTRTVLIPKGLWCKLIAERAGDDDYIFPSSRTKSHLTASQAWRIVRAAGLRAIDKGISPHWFRHAHASHAIDRGAPISLVQKTLGHSSVGTTSRYVHAKPNDSSSLYLPIK